MREKTLHVVAAALLLAGAGCISHAPETIDPDAPVALRVGAQELRGLDRRDVIVPAAKTLADVPLTSATYRNVAEGSKNAVVSLFIEGSVRYRVGLLPIHTPITSVPVWLPGKALGSGFFIHPTGYVLTNDHVVRDAKKVHGLLRDGSKIALEVLARDPVFDLAILEVSDPQAPYPVLPMGDADVIAPGDVVMAVGNPLGLGHTVTLGIVSQTDRDLTGVEDEDRRRVDFLQIDAAINPGSSGGPLITLTGAWIGVNTAGAAGAQNIGFAVPSTQVLEFIDEVLRGEGVPEVTP